MKRVAIYPGSFDPITNGHLNVIERAARLFDTVIVAIARNLEKTPLFPIADRQKITAAAIAHLLNVRVICFTGLLVDFARHKKACALIRGLRAVSDFEFEFQMALMNRRMAPDIETLFLMPKDTCAYLSSHMIKEIARLGGDVGKFVPPVASRALARKFRKNKKRNQE